MSERKIREMGVSDARANMTDVIAEARLLDVDFVLTRRDKPQAVLMSIKRHNQALAHADVIAQLRSVFDEDTSVANTFRAHYSTLYNDVMATNWD
ncbi:type II toxin-antitoxin system Phd/YefM family antitoxin [Streptomyces sp. 351MFTsu5.1]|uniref:type II toxin-antitoxin system Phd/YefM family antitoxin n=1 Tax=Streptomyces sp. 351MFTsu5.1 TaxID=1172180 RepID=UPI0009961127|nr:type II toxin-antitoxin system Phd/YefM family antitoxin [Streptomyces sp. 351MFTsu5.1]